MKDLKDKDNLIHDCHDEVVPTEEPKRQYYYMERLRELSKGEARKPGFKVITFGCQMNARDSEKLAGILEKAGYTEAEDELSADIVIFNTCTIRENANEHLYGRLGRLKQSKKADPRKVVAICGCMMQEKDEIEKISKTFPYVDIMFGTHNLYTFPELLYKLFEKRRGLGISIGDSGHDVLVSSDQSRTGHSLVSVWKDSSDIVEDLPTSRKFPFKQGVNISYGCNNFCSYCIVPYVRGREKSRRKEDILEEIRRLGEDGVKEIMLLGQNVNSYGRTLTEPVSFAKLLTEVDELCDSLGIERIRFMTSHPKDLSDELIEAMAAGKHIMHQFHLPLQSGSDRILRLMNRHYDSKNYFERAEKLRAAMPDISISTDIIVGFPGETEEDFEATLDMVKRMRYDAAYTFIYSEREGTPAASFPDKVPEEIIKERFQRLLSVQNSIAGENCRRLEGRSLPVLFEEINEKDPSLINGRLENNSLVHVKGDASLIGSIRDVRLIKAHSFYYTGELCG